jgi:hypothetical protein
MTIEYSISKTKRNLITFSAVFLILKNIVLIVFAYLYHASDPEKPMWILWSIERILQIIPYGYIMIVMADYFRHYQLKVLQLITLGILALEIIGHVIHYFNHAKINLPKPLLIGNSIIWTLAMIVWIVFLFRVSTTKFAATNSIRKYAISVLAVILISGTLPLLINQLIDIQKYSGIVVGVIFLIPYVFFIEFGLKLPLKE